MHRMIKFGMPLTTYNTLRSYNDNIGAINYSIMRQPLCLTTGC